MRPALPMEPLWMYFGSMTKTITIKQVPKALADGLRRRAAANRRSQQRELLLILERALAIELPERSSISEPTPLPYAGSASRGKSRREGRGDAKGRLTLEQLWERARKLGTRMPDESTDIVRRDRDARHGH